MALCLTVKECEFIHIGDVRISIMKYQGRRMKVWIEAPKTTVIKHEKGVG